MTQAFKELIKQLLTQPQSSLDNWKSRILDAIGEWFDYPRYFRIRKDYRTSTTGCRLNIVLKTV